MVSKGIDCFTYLSTSQFKTVVASRGNSNINFNFVQHDQNTTLGKMQTAHCEISRSSLDLFENTGRLRIDAYHNNTGLLSRYAEVNPVTGNIADSNIKKCWRPPQRLEKIMRSAMDFMMLGQERVTKFMFTSRRITRTGWAI